VVNNGASEVKVCACCGHPLPVYDTLKGLTPSQQRIFELVEKAGQAGVSRRELMDKIYGGNPNGGPSSPNVLNVQKTKMQIVLQSRGLKITSEGGHYARWRLEKIG
jgi:hypothetical protein